MPCPNDYESAFLDGIIVRLGMNHPHAPDPSFPCLPRTSSKLFAGGFAETVWISLPRIVTDQGATCHERIIWMEWIQMNYICVDQIFSYDQWNTHFSWNDLESKWNLTNLKNGWLSGTMLIYSKYNRSGDCRYLLNDVWWMIDGSRPNPTEPVFVFLRVISG